MKFFQFMLLVGSVASIQLNKERIADTPEPHLIPKVMEVDRDTKWALCNGSNSGKCREAEPFLARDDKLVPKNDGVFPEAVKNGTRRW